MIARRSQTPNGTDRQQYQNAWKIISEIAAGYEVAA
jgi:hypothetical protein